MGNGRQSTQFNTEHSKITDSILASEQVSDLDEELYNDIVERLRNISVSKRTSNLSVGILSNESMRRQRRGNSTPNIVLLHNNEVASIPANQTSLENELLIAADNEEAVWLCPSYQCEGLSESLAVGIRNHHDSEPNNDELTLPKAVNEQHREETHRKEGYEPCPVVPSPGITCTPKTV